MNKMVRMSAVFTRIIDLKREYATLPFFEFLRDSRIDAAERMAFYPCMAHFILSFGDLNKYVLRREPAQDLHQERINLHTYEDDHHWPWYLEDFSKLGFDTPTTPTACLGFLWSEETRQSRILMYRLTAMIEQASSLERLAIIEAIEETGHILFTTILSIAQTLEERLGTELRYCGLHHFNLESGHAMGSENHALAAMEIGQVTLERCLHFVEAVFHLFTEWTEELLHFAQRRVTSHRLGACT